MAQQAIEPAFLTQIGAAQFLNISARHLQRLSRVHDLGQVKFGHVWRYDRRALEAFAQSQRVPLQTK
jgi:hypothetical protein